MPIRSDFPTTNTNVGWLVDNLSWCKAEWFGFDLQIWPCTIRFECELQNRLRAPTSKSGFNELIAILSNPGEPLPDDRQERRARLLAFLRDGSTQSLCHIIRDLHAYRKIRPLNESDQSILKQARNSLLGEWGFVRSMTPAEAEHELNHWLMFELPDVD